MINKGDIILAPMAGVTDRAFREIARDFYCDYAYTEMVSIMALHYDNAKTWVLLDNYADEENLAVQLFGHSPDIMAEAALRLKEGGAKHIDINMGCPTPKIVKNGDGCALMENIALAADLIDAAKQSGLPVSIKIRKGRTEGSVNAADFVKMAYAHGVSHVALHSRTGSQGYSGKADIDFIGQIARAADIPIVGNGDVRTHEDYRAMLAAGAHAVMVGRATLGKPWLLGEIAGREYSCEQKLSAIESHYNKLIQYKGDHIGELEWRKHKLWYNKTMHNIEQRNA